jgi:predicted N-acyltransferase
MTPTATVIRVESALKPVDRTAWDTVANPGWRVLAGGRVEPDGTPAEAYNPFVSYDFLSSLEDSGSLGGRSGWHPQYFVVPDGDGIAAAAPAYLKTHSQGEYVFDHGWADAWERAGGNYYPKLQVTVPFTPATGPRLLAGSAEKKHLLAAGIAQLTRDNSLSSAHVTFASEGDVDLLAENGWLRRLDRQFHWRNEGYGSYDDFLAALASRKRKALKRERRDALADGITIEQVTGADLTEAHWDAFFEFYMDTGSRKWGRPYLNRRFFSLVGERMPERVLLVMARRAGRWIAGALNFIGSDRLYGRNWGAVEHHPFLHFEVCYHQAMDFAIARSLAVVEAGAQGEHKLARGYLPVTTQSAHYIPNDSFRRAVEDYLKRERMAVLNDQLLLSEESPFRHDDGA